MSDLFKILCQDETDLGLFGICDDKPHQRAYIDNSDGQKWTAVISNKFNRKIVFTALDNSIEFNKANGKSESRCEGILTYEETIIFIEIKERTGDAKTWARKADTQLRNSISIVLAKVDLDIFTNKKAYICNRHQKNLNESHAVRTKKFQNETGFILRVDKRINIE